MVVEREEKSQTRAVLCEDSDFCSLEMGSSENWSFCMERRMDEEGPPGTTEQLLPQQAWEAYLQAVDVARSLSWSAGDLTQAAELLALALELLSFSPCCDSQTDIHQSTLKRVMSEEREKRKGRKGCAGMKTDELAHGLSKDCILQDCVLIPIRSVLSPLPIPPCIHPHAQKPRNALDPKVLEG
ncbi:hypothetical protein Q9966_013915 [Columba livia]|nr:hypothetical protein Q9966_013915 [Columba livia]